MKNFNLPTKAAQFLSVLLLTLIISSCKTEPKAAEKTQMQRVMEVHDAVMPKMGAIGRLVKELGAKRDSLIGLERTDSIHIAALGKGIDSLKGGHKKMMDWMKDFGAQFTAEEILKGKALTATKTEALAQEAIKVSKMEAAITGSIGYAESLLKE